MNFYQTVRVDLSKPKTQNVRVKQLDTNSRYLDIIVQDNGVPFNLSGVVNGAAYMRKPDNTTIFCSADVVDCETGRLRVSLSEQAVAVMGIVRAEILLYGDTNSLLTSFWFHISVHQSLHDDRAIQSSNEFSKLTELLSVVGNIGEKFDSKRDKAVKLVGTDFDLSSDERKLKLANLSDEVKQAMAGDTPINASVANGAVTTEKYADNSLVHTKMKDNLWHRLEKASVQAFGQISSISNGTVAGTRVVTTEPIRLHVLELGKISPKIYAVAPLDKMSIPDGQAVYVDLNDLSTETTELTAKITTTHFLSVGENGSGAFFDDRRVILIANNSGYLSGILSQNINTVKQELHANKVFFTPKGLMINYDPKQKKLSWMGSILLIDPLSPFNRTKITNGSYTFTGNQYQVCYIDLDVLRVQPNGEDTASVSIKGGAYSDTTNPNRFTGSPNQLPIFWIHDSSFGSVGDFPQAQVLSSGYPSPLADDRVAVGFEQDKVFFFLKASRPHTYIEYVLSHEITSTADSWRISEAYVNKRNQDGSFIRIFEEPIVTNAEWECAIREQGSTEFVGGVMHGNEKLTNVYVICDGIKRKIQVNETMSCREVRFVEQSTIFRYGTTDQPLAYHTRVYSITPQGVHFEQKLKWVQTIHLANGYLAMLPIRRTFTNSNPITDAAYCDNDHVLLDCSTPANMTEAMVKRKNVKQVNIWSDLSEIGAELKILHCDPKLPDANLFISNSNYYNKIYFDFCGYCTVKPGDVWEIQSSVNINIV